MAFIQKNPSWKGNDWQNQVVNLLPTNLVLKNFEESRAFFFHEDEKIERNKKDILRWYLSEKDHRNQFAFSRGKKAALIRFIVKILSEGIIWRFKIHDEVLSIMDLALTLANKLLTTQTIVHDEDKEYRELTHALAQYFEVVVFLPHHISPRLNHQQQTVYDFLLKKEFLIQKRHDNGPSLRVSLNDWQETFDFLDSEIDRIFHQTLNNVAVFF